MILVCGYVMISIYIYGIIHEIFSNWDSDNTHKFRIVITLLPLLKSASAALARRFDGDHDGVSWQNGDTGHIFKRQN